jgi:hypothetical protein
MKKSDDCCLYYTNKKELLAKLGISDSTLARWEEALLFPKRIIPDNVQPVRAADGRILRRTNMRCRWWRADVDAYFAGTWKPPTKSKLVAA